MNKRVGKGTVVLGNPVGIIGFASVVGKREGEGPLKNYFDFISEDTTFGEKTWEKSESQMQKQSVNRAIKSANVLSSEIDYILAGDLLNQCIGSTYGLREFEIPLVGLFGACSTMAEGLAVGSMLIDGGFATNVCAVTSSHFCSAERQFRMPLEYGGQRPPTAQWTVTGSASAILSPVDSGIYIKRVTIGKIVDMGICDANNMGGAMAPSAVTTLMQFFDDTKASPADYDLIVTGDLGKVGKGVVEDIMKKEGLDLGKAYNDCGCMIFDLDTQGVDSGGSGCGCSAVVLTSYILPKIKSGEFKNVLFIGTGALMSPTAVAQGESIPGIAHLIEISNVK